MNKAEFEVVWSYIKNYCEIKVEDKNLVLDPVFEEENTDLKDILSDQIDTIKDLQ